MALMGEHGRRYIISHCYLEWTTYLNHTAGRCEAASQLLLCCHHEASETGPARVSRWLEAVWISVLSCEVISWGGGGGGGGGGERGVGGGGGGGRVRTLVVVVALV